MLTEGEWYWKEAASHSPTPEELSSTNHEPGWCPGGAPPSEIHILLLQAGLISDPYVQFNEHEVQCES